MKVLILLFSFVHAATLIHQRILESEDSFKNLVIYLKSYEIHNFHSDYSTKRVLQRVGEERFAFEVEVLGRKLKLQLERHDDLFAKDYKHHLLDESGNVIASEPPLECVYRGSVENSSSLSATVTLCSGMVHATILHSENGQDLSFSIQPLEMLPESDHIVYFHKNVEAIKNFCATEDLIDARSLFMDESLQSKILVDNSKFFTVNPDDSLLNFNSKSSIGMNQVHERDLQDSLIKYVGVSVVNDHRRYLEKGPYVHLHSTAILAASNALFAKLGVITPSFYKIKLEIVSMYTFAVSDPWTELADAPASNKNVPLDVNGEVNPSDLLAAFNDWRYSNVLPLQNLTEVNGHDVAHLLTGYQFQHTAIGIAYTHGVCDLYARASATQGTVLTDPHMSSTVTHGKFRCSQFSIIDASFWM